MLDGLIGRFGVAFAKHSTNSQWVPRTFEVCSVIADDLVFQYWLCDDDHEFE